MNNNKNQHLKFKKRVAISSLYAAICNVALFKNMKEKQFKDQIFISYSEEGVMVQANSQQKWQQANSHIMNFLVNKRISLLTYGYEKQVYEDLIIKGLKDYTRKIKQKYQQCPYINIIHYQKLRKSCEYMDREKYVEPLKDWQRKNKTNPNFAFLIVQPKQKFAEVKRNLLQFLLSKTIKLQQISLSPIDFLYHFYNSPAKQILKEAFDKQMIEINIAEDIKIINPNRYCTEKMIKIVNYSEVDLQEHEVAIVKNHKNLSKLGLEFVSSNDVQSQLNNVKWFIRDASSIFQKVTNNLLEQYGNNYAIIAYRKYERQKYLQLINKFTNLTYTKSELEINLKKYIVCEYKDIQFYQILNQNSKQIKSYTIHRSQIKGCPFMLYQYHNIKEEDLDTFLIYLEHLSIYYNTYMVRFYGICNHPNSNTIYYLIFDYHQRTLYSMLHNDQILDVCQVATMILQILYLIRYLHTHEQPRCIGKLSLQQIYWPICVVLPYLTEQHQNSVQGDIKLVGGIMKQLAMDEPQQFADVLNLMLKENKYDRIIVSKCIVIFQELLAL